MFWGATQFKHVSVCALLSGVYTSGNHPVDVICKHNMLMIKSIVGLKFGLSQAGLRPNPVDSEDFAHNTERKCPVISNHFQGLGHISIFTTVI